MLKRLKEDDIETAVNLAYDLSLNPSTNSYQLRNSKTEFSELFTRYKQYCDDELLGYFINGELIAVIYLYVLKKDAYLQTNAIFIKDEVDKVLYDFIKYIKSSYSGYEIYIGYPKENENAINCLLSYGFTITESSIDQRVKRQDFIQSNLKNLILRINNDNYIDFAKFHDYKAKDMYWNSQRIKSNIDNWILYSYWSDSKIKATIATKKVKNMVEIFALLIDEKFTNMGIEEDLIIATINEAFEDENVDNVVYFIDSDDHIAEAYSKKLGFTIYSNYRCLSVKL